MNAIHVIVITNLRNKMNAVIKNTIVYLVSIRIKQIVNNAQKDFINLIFLIVYLVANLAPIIV